MICSNCKGEGLVGVGAEPWLKQGPVSTCVECSGTGNVLETATAEAVAPSAESPVSIAESEPVKASEEIPVDNSNSADVNFSEGSSDVSQDAVKEPEVVPVEVPVE